MRVVIASIVVAAAIGACASFAADEKPTTSPPDASRETGASSSSRSSTSSGGAANDGGFVCPDTGFCDDFTRADASDVKGPWTSLQHPEGDPLPKIEEGAFHLFAAAVSAGAVESEQWRTYLERDLPSCAGLVVAVDFDFMLEEPLRNGNIAVIVATDNGGLDHFTTLALTADPSLAVVTGNSTPGSSSAVVTVAAPAANAWTHARLTFDALHQQIYARVGTMTVGPYPSDPLTDVARCRFTIGNDFIGHGPASSRRYDNVTAQVTAAP